MGRTYDPSRYEGLCALGGDGTVYECVTGLLSRPNWAELVRRVPICTIKMGTNNAVAFGVRTIQPEYACYCMIKRRLRPLDAMVVLNAAGARTISMCVAGFGVASSVVLESEMTRSSFGLYRCVIGATQTVKTADPHRFMQSAMQDRPRRGIASHLVAF